MIVVGLFWNVHCIGKVVLKNKFNFASAVIRSKRSSCSNLFAGSSPKEGKKSVSEKTTISALSQTIATALTFARIQQKRHSEHHTFPTLRVHPLGVDIILHNAISDHLMVTCLAWSRHALFMLWLVLHHNLFSFLQVPKGYERYTSGFLHYIETSGAMKTEPKYLVFKNSFELKQEELVRERWLLLPKPRKSHESECIS